MTARTRAAAALTALTLLLGGGALLRLYVQTPAPRPVSALPLAAWRPGLSRGVNLEGWLGGGPFVPVGAAQLAQLQAVRAAGFDFVRVPLDSALFTGPPAAAQEPGASLARVLRAAAAQGLGVSIAVSPGSGLKREVLLGGAARDTHLALLEGLAGMIATSGVKRAVLEPLDEPVDPERADCGPSRFNWTRELTAYLAAVRRAAPTLPVLVTGSCYADATSLVDLRPLADRNVMYGFQYLDPLTFTQQGNPNDSQWAALRGVHYSAAAQAATQATFALVGHWAQRYGVPVTLTSFAVHRSAPPADRLNWLADARRQAEAWHLNWAVWSWQSPYGFGLSDGHALPDGVRRALNLPAP